MIKLSLLYWSYFSVFGVLIPYAGRYLRGYGYGYEQIGLVMALMTSANIFAPFLIARLSDLSGKRVLLAQLSSMLLLVCLWLLDPAKGVTFTLIIMFSIGVALSMALPQIEAITMGYLGADKHKYGIIRLWGSLGFLTTVWATGMILDALGNEWFRYLQLILITLLILLFQLVSDQNIVSTDQVRGSSGLELLKKPVVLVFFLVMLLNQAAIAPYNIFADLYLQANDYNSSEIGTLLALAPFMEALLMAMLPLLLFRLGYFPIVIAALILSIVRWNIMAWAPDSVGLMIFAQSLHAFSFGAMHGVAIYLVARLFSTAQQGMGQSLYVSLVSGAGLVLGNFVAGVLWQNGGGAQWVFILASLACALGLVLTLLFLRPAQLVPMQMDQHND